MSTKPFPVKLTEAERERLEAHRIALGARSHADVIRYWIATPVDSDGVFRRIQMAHAATEAGVRPRRLKDKEPKE